MKLCLFLAAALLPRRAAPQETVPLETLAPVEAGLAAWPVEMPAAGFASASPPGPALSAFPAAAEAIENFLDLGANASGSELHQSGREIQAALTGERRSAAPSDGLDAAVLYAPFGGGHKAAAQALVKAYEAKGLRAEAVDITRFMPGWQARFFKWAYYRLQSGWPKGLEVAYDVSAWALGRRALRWLIRRFDARASEPLIRYLVERRPGAILTAYPPTTGLEKARLDGRLPSRLGVVVTDWRTHPAWTNIQADRYYVAGARVAAELEARGVPSERIAASGIPIDPRIASVVPEPAGPKKTVLIMGGVNAAGPIEEVVRGFKGVPGVRLEIVAGDNPKAKARLEKIAGNLGLDAVVHGLVPHDRLMAKMAAAALVISKPGGLTVTEAAALGKPMILLGPPYAQEKGNAEAVIEHEAGAMTDDAAAAARMAVGLLSRPAALARMGRNARRLARPDAAEAIIDDLGGTSPP